MSNNPFRVFVPLLSHKTVLWWHLFRYYFDINETKLRTICKLFVLIKNRFEATKCCCFWSWSCGRESTISIKNFVRNNWLHKRRFINNILPSTILSRLNVKTEIERSHVGHFKEILPGAADIASWYRLHPSSCGRGFESQAHYLCFFQFVLLKL